MARGGADREARPLHDDRLPDERVGALLGHRPAGRHLVREARHLEHGPAPVRARVQPGRPAAVGGAQRLGRLRRRWPSGSRSWRRRTSACAATSSPRRCCTTRRRSWPSPAASCATGRPASASPFPGKTMPKLIVVERDYGAVHDKMTALGPLVENAGIAWKGISWKPAQEVEELRRRNGVVRGGVADGRPQLRTAKHVAETIFRLSGTTNGRLAVEGFRQLEQRTGTELADLATDREDDRITLEQVQIQPRKVITSPEWSGIESRTRRYSPFTVNVGPRGAVAHPHRAPALLRRPRLDARVRRGAARPTARRSRPRGTRRATWTPAPPRSSCAGSARTRSGRSTPSTRTTCGCSSCSAAGRSSGSHPATPSGSARPTTTGSRRCNRNGVIACRAVVSHRIPEGSAFMYHSQDRHVNVPISETSGHPRRHRQLASRGSSSSRRT